MSQGPDYILDTCILLVLIRGQALGNQIDQKYALRTSSRRPLVSIVSHGEIWVLARKNNWGGSRINALTTMLQNLVPVDINHTRVIDAYVDIDIHSRTQIPAGAIKMGKNDLWIAACARASGAHLLTTDGDFDHLYGTLIQGTRV